jgi:hypothetical protein
MNNKIHIKENIYDVSTYTDTELYNILDLNSPSDRELEAKILFFINKYENMQNESGNQLAQFFNDIYKHFFDVSESDDSDSENENYQNIFTPNNPLIENMDNMTTDNSGQYDLINSNSNSNSNAEISIAPELQGENYSNNIGTAPIDYTRPLEYSQDNLNPLLQQTTKRLISIDSQFRSDKSGLSSNFTVELSEPLKDVVSMKLYSIQIPYTWYTISTDYGSNLIYLNGNSSGIDNGNHDISFSITPGNYSPQELIDTINNSISIRANNNYDVNFGNTKLIYNPNTSIVTTNIDIYKQFNETSYRLEFPDISYISPFAYSDLCDNNFYRSSNNVSIGEFLGFSDRKYYTYVLNGNFNLQSTSSNSNSNDSNFRIYKLTDKNNYFTVYKYIGPNEYNENSIVDLSFDVSFSLNINNINNYNYNYTRNDLVNDINNQINNCPYLDSENSYLNRFDVSSITIDPSMTGFKNNSFFQLKLKLNRKTTKNISNSKIRVVFHEDPSVNTNIWTGTAGSCFQFYDLSSEINNIISDTYPVQNSMIRYDLSTNAYIRFICNKSGFDMISNVNSYEIKLIQSPYSTLKQYIDGFNNSIFIASDKNNYEIDTNNTKGFVDNTGVFNFDIDITKIINESNFLVDLSGYYNPTNNSFSNNNNNNNSFNRVGFFTSFLGQSKNIIDLSNNKFELNYQNKDESFDSSYVNVNIKNIIDGSYNINQLTANEKHFLNQYNYKFDLSRGNIIKFQFDYQNNYDFYDISYLAVIGSNFDFSLNPLSKVSKRNTTEYYVKAPIGKYYLNELPEIINRQFSNFVDIDGDNVLSGSNFTFEIDSSNNKVNGFLQIIINKIITQNDYKIGFYEYTTNNDNFNTTDNRYVASRNSSWVKYLDISLNLINSPNIVTALSSYLSTNNSYSVIKSNNPIPQYRIELTDKNNYFDIIPIDDGVLSNSNKIRIKVDRNTYSRDSLIETINNKFQSNPLTENSQISIFTNKNGNERTKIRLTINKEYFAKDFILNFYDPYYFVNCYSSRSFKNTTWDSTLGWILGYRTNTIYTLSDYTSDKGAIKINGDTTITTNLYNYFAICIDDFNNNHFSNGLVTINVKNDQIDLPSYANKSNFVCDPVTGGLSYNTTSVTDYNNLTQNQIYAVTETYNSIISKNKNTNLKLSNPYTTGPYIQDVFAVVPLRLSGLANGSYIVDNGGSLQNQQRLYFGPVNLFKFSIKLLDDRGNIVNLNNSNWSFTILCDLLYKPTPSK